MTQGLIQRNCYVTPSLLRATTGMNVFEWILMCALLLEEVVPVHFKIVHKHHEVLFVFLMIAFYVVQARLELTT